MKLITFLFILFTALACTFGEDAERYSSFECAGYDAAHPEDLAARNCVLRDVVLASEKGQPTLLFYARPGQATPLLSAADEAAGRGRIAEIAPRVHASVRVVRAPLPAGLAPVAATAALVSAQGNGLAAFLLDTLFGLHWMLGVTGDVNATTGAARDPGAVTVVEVGRASAYTAIVHGSLSARPPAPLRDLAGVCFARVVVGAARHQLLARARSTNPDAYPVAPAHVAAYRAFFRAVARPRAADHNPAGIVLSHRLAAPRVRNTAALLEALAAAGNAQVAFLAQLPVRSQVELVANSGVFVAAHSDDMAYMLFLRPGSAVVELFPVGYASDVYRRVADACGLRYAAWHAADRAHAHFDPALLDRYPLSPAQRRAVVDADRYSPDLPQGALAYWSTQDIDVDPVAVTDVVRSVLPAFPDNEKSPVEEDDDVVDVETDVPKHEL